jgi:hypothetical protein
MFSVAIWLAACTSPSASPASAVPGPSDQAAAQDCPTIDLRDPSGEPVILTGTWQASDYGVYEMHQGASCLYWFGRSEYPGSEPGEYFATVLYGTIQRDFTIVGHWGDVPLSPDAALNYGEITLRLEFDMTVEPVQPVLRVTGATGGFGATAWVRSETVGPAEEIIGVLGGNYDELYQTGCVWIESVDRRYELLDLAGYGVRGNGTTMLLIDPQGRLVGQTGDPIRAVGRVAAPLGTCTDSTVLVEEFGLAP